MQNEMDWQEIIDNDELLISPPQDAAMHGVLYPNVIAKLKHQPKIGVLACFETEIDSQTGFPVGQHGLDYLTRQKQNGWIDSGFVLMLRGHKCHLFDINNDTGNPECVGDSLHLEFLNAMPFEEVKNRLQGHEPHGNWNELIRDMKGGEAAAAHKSN